MSKEESNAQQSAAVEDDDEPDEWLVPITSIATPRAAAGPVDSHYKPRPSFFFLTESDFVGTSGSSVPDVQVGIDLFYVLFTLFLQGRYAGGSFSCRRFFAIGGVGC